MALSLNPNFKIVEVSYPYVSQRLLTGESPQLRRRLLDVLIDDGKFQWQRLENMIEIASSDDSFDLLPTARLGLEYLLSEEGKYLRQQLLLALTEGDRLHTDEISRLWSLIQDDIKPQKILDFAFTAFRQISVESMAAIVPSAPASR